MSAPILRDTKFTALVQSKYSSALQMYFEPIEPKMALRSLPVIVKPTVRRLKRAVQMSNYQMKEFDSLLRAGKNIHSVQSAIKKDRGGVLPTNWETALDIKKLMEDMRVSRIYN